jgi:SEL1 protein
MLGVMQFRGTGVVSNCIGAVRHFKRVVEKSKWGYSYLEKAHTTYENGDLERALVNYEKLAVLGFEVAQSNVAWINENDLPHDDPQSQLKALEYYMLSAEQGNSFSYLKLGDMFFDGVGTEQSFPKAVIAYQRAGDMGQAQALFNLGYMHQAGLGLPQDLHLAKRYYDSAQQVDVLAFLPVNLALVGLALHYAYVALFVDPISLTLFDIAVQWDTFLIALLSGLLVAALLLRRQLA